VGATNVLARLDVHELALAAPHQARSIVQTVLLQMGTWAAQITLRPLLELAEGCARSGQASGGGERRGSERQQQQTPASVHRDRIPPLRRVAPLGKATGMRKLMLLVLWASMGCAAPMTEPPATACPGTSPAQGAPALPSAAPPVMRDSFMVDATWPDALDRPAFERLRKRAAEEHSTALILLHDGKLLHEENPLGKGELDTPSIAMSATKSVVALLIGKLVDQGALSLDEPLATTHVPEWKTGGRETISLRHLLNHTSGLDPVRASARAFVDNKRVGPFDIEKTGVEAELVTPVGSKFKYNNQAVDFLSVIVRRLFPDGVRLDDMLQKLIFADLGVVGAFWSKDDRGDPRAAGELMMRPIDLAKIGQLVLDGGSWRGKRILSKGWMDTMLSAGQPLYDGCGLLWWRDGRKRDGGREVVAYRADGYLGQYIIVVPDKRLVAVRMRDPRRTSWSAEEYNYKDFMWDVLAMAGHPIAANER
jgi:CubicO group peptidase (beta-lactamase class C family)